VWTALEALAYVCFGKQPGVVGEEVLSVRGGEYGVSGDVGRADAVAWDEQSNDWTIATGFEPEAVRGW